MNNKFIITSFAAIALGAMGFFMTQSMDNSSLTPTQLSNVEALADSEGGGDSNSPKGCMPYGNGCAINGCWIADHKPVY